MPLNCIKTGLRALVSIKLYGTWKKKCQLVSTKCIALHDVETGVKGVGEGVPDGEDFGQKYFAGEIHVEGLLHTFNAVLAQD